jgi:biopolymer transport protein ExbD
MWLAGRPIAADQLVERLSAARVEHGDQVEVRIRGSRVAAYSHFEPIMLACTKAKIWNVTYAVYSEEPN